MEQYISKSALVAEINKRIMDAPINCYGHQRVWAYNDVKDILDTLEVKEVDLDDEYTKEVYSHLDSIKDTADRMTSGNFMHNRAAIKFSANTIAKVLELMGLKAQKGE